MSGLWRQCCPDCGEAVCSDMCSEPWKSSYVLTGLAGSYSYSKVHTMTPSCQCIGQGIQTFRRNWSVSATWTQPTGIVITRATQAPGVCCYYGQGTVVVDATVEVEEMLLCCDPPYTVTTATQTFQRNGIEVPVCISLTCGDGVDECQPTGVGRKFTLNACMCDFPFQESVTLNRAVEFEPCSNQLEPEPETGLVMGGVCWFYEAVLKEPRALLAGERSLGSVCSFAPGACDVYGSTLGDLDPKACMPCVRFDQTFNGPFALYFAEPFTIGIDDPGTCSCPGGIAIIGPVRSFTECGSSASENCAPCVANSATPDCCEAIVNRDLPWPVFT